MSTEDDILSDTGGDDDVSALYHKADGALPPASLDESILATAQRAVEHGRVTHKPARAPFSGHWPVAVSAAAVFIIAVILAPSLEKQAPLPDATSDNAHALREQAEAENAVRERLPAQDPARSSEQGFSHTLEQCTLNRSIALRSNVGGIH